MLLFRYKILLQWLLLFSCSAAFVRVGWFAWDQLYAWDELRVFAPYYLTYHLLLYGGYAIVLAAALALIWHRWPNFEGLLLAGLSALPFGISIAYYINKQWLPAFKSLPSVVGNAVMLIAGVFTILFVFDRYWRNLRMLAGTHSRYGLRILFAMVLLVVMSYRLQPHWQRLAPAPASWSEEFVELFADDAFAAQFTAKALSDTEPSARVALAQFRGRASQVRAEILEVFEEAYGDTTKLLAAADKIVQREFTFWNMTRRIDEDINWTQNPTEDVLWLYLLNESEWLWELCAAYIVTGDARYASDVNRILESWFAQNEEIYWKDEEHAFWRLLTAGLRVSDGFINVFYTFLDAPEVSQENKIRLLASIQDHAQFLSYFRSRRRNHLIQETFGLLKCAALFPEFRMAGHWQELALQRLDKVMAMDVYPDGAYTENSTFYQYYVLLLFKRIAAFSDRYSVALSTEFHRKLEKMFAFQMHMTRPDGSMPQLNDGFHGDPMPALFDWAARRFNRPDFSWQAGNRTFAQPPARRSAAFDYAGLYSMRSSWENDAAHMLFDAGLFGSGHGHEDKLSIELSVGGVPAIVDPGTFTYVFDRWHRFFESTAAHNSILIDGKGQLRYWNNARWDTQAGLPLQNFWRSTPEFDLVSATYSQGYGWVKERLDKRIEHTRTVLFIKPDYWVIWDVLHGQGEHSAEQLFHFLPMPVSETEHLQILARPGGSSHLILQPLLRDGLSRQQYLGEDEPIQGWVAPRYDQKLPAPVVGYRRQGKLPLVFLTVLLPIETRLSASAFRISVAELSEISPASGFTCLIAGPDWEDRIQLDPQFPKQLTSHHDLNEYTLHYHRLTPAGETLKTFDQALAEKSLSSLQ